MTWRDGDLLWLLLLVPLAAGMAIAAWRLRQRALLRFGNPATVGVLVAGRAAPWRATRAVLRLLGLSLVIVALAGPRFGSRTQVLRKRGVDIVFALDFSKSMLARDVRPSRIERAKAELLRLIDGFAGHRVGVVPFAGETMELPMTTDYAAIGLFLRELGPYDMPVGGTALGRALTSAGRLLERARTRRTERAEELTDAEAAALERSQVVILLTDGEDHEGDPVAVAEELAGEGIRIYTIGIGSRSGEPIPTYASDGTWTGYVRDENGQAVTTALTAENEAQLERIAEVSGGRYYRAERGDVGAREIAQLLEGLEQGDDETRRITVHEERYALALLPAFLLLLLEALLPEAWIGRRRRRGGKA
ncbi:MAG: VWA domain-containing protein [Myxococcota bacterium]